MTVTAEPETAATATLGASYVGERLLDEHPEWAALFTTPQPSGADPAAGITERWCAALDELDRDVARQVDQWRVEHDAHAAAERGLLWQRRPLTPDLAGHYTRAVASLRLLPAVATVTPAAKDPAARFIALHDSQAEAEGAEPEAAPAEPEPAEGGPVTE